MDIRPRVRSTDTYFTFTDVLVLAKYFKYFAIGTLSAY